MRHWYSILLALSLWVVSGCTAVTTSVAPAGAAGATSQPIAVKLGVGYIPNVQFAPFYVGMEKGFFASEGIDLTLEYGFENDYLKLVGVDDLQFMVGSGDQVVLGRGQGLPVRYVMNWYTKYPVVVFAKSERNIVEPEDLKGKKIGLPGPFGANYVALRGILEAAGLSEADITQENVGFAQVAALSEDRVDAAVDYAVNGPVVFAQQGISTTQIAMDDYLPMPANGLVTNEKTIAGKPELVEKMVRATLHSIRYTLENPDEAFQIALQHVPEAGGDNAAANRAVFDASLAYWTPPAGVQPGATTQEVWQGAAQFMQRIGLVDQLVPADELYTNEFLE